MATPHTPQPSDETEDPPRTGRQLEAVYRDGALWPDSPVDLPSGARVRLSLLETVGSPDGAGPPAATAFPHPGRAAALVVAGMVAAILAQLAVARGLLPLGAAGYALAVGLVVAGARGPAPEAAPSGRAPRLLGAEWRLWLTAAALLQGAVAFVFSAGNRYTPANVLPWLTAVACFLAAHLDYGRVAGAAALLRSGGWPAAARAWLTRERALSLAALLAILALGAAFRFADLAGNPAEMNSDQAEKLLDVGDVLAGTNYIFFERNTGREPWQFYWTVALIRLLGLPPDFMALKLGTALIGWLMLPAVFLLGREVLGTRGALLATLFAAVASWGVITARFGLRYPLAPCAAAWTLFFLVRGLRRDSRNSLLLAGLWVGIGLQGYTAYRFMAVVVPLVGAAWLWWLLARGERARAGRVVVGGLLALALAALTLLPLIRYGLERPEQLLYRAATRLTAAEQAIPGDPAAIFLENLRNVLLMFNYTRDSVWVANLPDRPAMDVILGALLVAGAAACLALSRRSGNPWPALTLGAGLLMLVPSALSIAFPGENPSVVRTGGALPALMVVCAAAPALALEQLRATGRRGAYLGALAAVAALGLAVAGVNQRRVFVDYPAQYCPRAQNASDIGRELLAWEAAGGDRRAAWIVGYPHWVDSRAVGVWIGEITFPNTVIGADEVRGVDLAGRPGWFALNREDLPALRALYERYPGGQERLVEGSRCAGRAFLVFETGP
ncbi:MAG TPA: glycosyltransferase family 39 protein [Chloroflexaceae bacterium]|nr:glycosyltransferase family 39 protein [Chloroflexaceae bacterium]